MDDKEKDNYEEYKTKKSKADIWIENLEKQFTKKGLNKKLNMPTPTGNFVYIPRSRTRK